MNFPFVSSLSPHAGPGLAARPPFRRRRARPVGQTLLMVPAGGRSTKKSGRPSEKT